MNKAVLIDRVRDKTGLQRLVAIKAVEAFVDTIKDSLAKGEDVHIVGFGSFKVLDRRARKGRNPRTGELIEVPAKKAVKFAPGKDFKERLAGGNSEANPEPEVAAPTDVPTSNTGSNDSGPAIS